MKLKLKDMETGKREVLSSEEIKTWKWGDPLL